MSPRVSVLLPVYDAEPYLQAALDSLLAQRFTDFEILAFDDGSRDGSRDRLLRAADRDPRIRLFLCRHRGLTEHLCRGVEQARGALVARMDADDVAHPERLARQVAYLDAHPECVAVGSEALLVDPRGRAIRRLGVATDHAGIDAELLRGRGDALLHPTAVMRRDALRAVGGYRPHHETSEDLDLFLRLAEHGRLANLPDTLLHYRQHLGKVSGRRKGEQRRVQDAILGEAYARRGLPERALPVRPPVSEQVGAAEAWHRWASWAIDAGERATGRHYALRLLRTQPGAARSWRLALRAALGLRLATARRLAAALGLRPAAPHEAAGEALNPAARLDDSPGVTTRLALRLRSALWRRLRPFVAPLHHVEAHTLEVRSLEHLMRALGWTRPPLLEGEHLLEHRNLTDLNDRRLRDAEVIGAACANTDAKVVLEIGTGLGHGTALLARNAPDATVHTVNVPPEEIGDAGRFVTFAPDRDEIGRHYRERGIANVRQILANTAQWKPDFQPIDVALIDGCHDSDFVYSDTRLVLERARPGTLVLWHDFHPGLVRHYPWIASVARGIERLYREGRLRGPILHLQDSWVGLYRVPDDAAVAADGASDA